MTVKPGDRNTLCGCVIEFTDTGEWRTVERCITHCEHSWVCDKCPVGAGVDNTMRHILTPGDHYLLHRKAGTDSEQRRADEIEAARRKGFADGLLDASDEVGAWGPGVAHIAAQIRSKAERVAALAVPSPSGREPNGEQK